MVSVISIILVLLLIYLGLGLVVYIFMVSGALKKIDADTAQSGFMFKLILLPGMLVFWPSIFSKWLKSK